MYTAISMVNELKCAICFQDDGIAAGLCGMLVWVSKLFSSFCSFSAPDGAPFDIDNLRTPCLSNKYINRFFFSSARPSSNANRCVSLPSTSWDAMIEAVADSRTTRDVISFRA